MDEGVKYIKWILLIGFNLPLFAWAQVSPIKFNHLSTQDGLSQNSVFAIVQDKQGFIWMGTDDGLSRYDGHTVKVFKHDPQNPNSLSSNSVRSLCADRDGTLWIGTNGGGLNHFNPITSQFTIYKHDPKDSSSLSLDRVFSIVQDHSGSIWIGTMGNGLNRFIPSTKQNTKPRFARYLHKFDDPTSLSDNKIWTIYEDSSNILWIGTAKGGLNKFFWGKDSIQANFIHYQHNPENSKSISSNSVRAILEDRHGKLWVGMEDGGLNEFDPKTGQLNLLKLV